MNKLSDKLYNWASIIDTNTLEQAKLLSTMPMVMPWVALMPDAHLGIGSTVGSVVPTVGAIVPSIVGVDIGCGVLLVRTQFKKDDLKGKDLSVLRHSIERSIPLSAGAYNSRSSVGKNSTVKRRIEELEDMGKDRTDFYDKACRTDWRYHLGSLGSGNHYIELTLDENDSVCLFLHSGSRGIGNKLAQHHIETAQQLMKKWYITLPDPNLAYLIEGTPEFDQYIEDLNWAQHFALLNREEMMDRVIKDFEHWVKSPVEEQERIQCHHNFTQKEHHMGKDVWLSRKGAIQADLGRPGLIPGSMGTASYVVEGKGCIPSFNSSPHGAGRVYSRGDAKRTFTLEQLKEAMVGIEFNVSDAFLDEIPQAYKDIDVVMEDAKDLVEIKHTLHQLLNVKGN